MRTLRRIRSHKQKKFEQPVRYHYILCLALAAVGAFWLIPVISVKFIKVMLGWIVALAGVITLYYPYLALKQKKKAKACLKDLDAAIARSTVETYVLRASRIALAPAHKDEADLYIIEYEPPKVLYFYDYHYQLTKKSIGRCFEIYETKFAELLGREVYHYGEHVTLMHIDSKSKWMYFTKHGAPAHLTTEVADLNHLVVQYSQYN